MFSFRYYRICKTKCEVTIELIQKTILYKLINFLGEFKIMQGDKPNNLGDGDQKQISAWDKFPLITEGNRKDKESKIQRQLWTEVRSGNRKNINIMKSESLIQEGEGNMNLKKYIMSHDVNKMQNQNSTCATGQDEPVIIKKSNSANDNKDLESTSNFGANNNQTIILKSASRNLICKSSSLESLKSSSTDTEISLKKCKTVENFRNSFRSTNSLPEQNDIEGVELSETSHFLTDENFEKKNIKEVKESSNLNIFLTKKTKDTIEVKPNSWLIVKNSREKGGKSFKRRSKQKTNVKKQSKHLFCTAERRLLSNRTNTSITLLKLRNTNCFQNFYKRLISIFCATSISTVATSK